MSDITSFFKRVPKKAEPILSIVSSEPAPKVEPTTSNSATTAAFYASLTPKQRLAHSIAAKALGTSYDVQRTHDYNNYLKN